MKVANQKTSLIRLFQTLSLALPVLYLPVAFPFTSSKVFLLRLFALAIGGLWLYRFLAGKKTKIVLTPAHYFALGFLVIGLTSSLFSIHPATSFLGHRQRFEGFFTWIAYASLFFVASQTFTDKGTARRLLAPISLAVALMAVFGIVQFLGFFPAYGPDWAGNRAASTLGQPIVFGGFLALTLPLVFHHFYRDRRLFAILALGFLALVVTFTRGAWLGLLASTPILVYVYRPAFSRSRYWRSVILGTALAAVLMVIVAAPRLSSQGVSSSIGERLASAVTEASVGPRLEMWRGSLKLLAKRPLIGYGFDTFAYAYPPVRSKESVRLQPYWFETHPHNLLADLLTTVGALGALLYLVALIYILWQAFRFVSRRGSDDRQLLVGSLLAGLVGYLVTLQLEISAVAPQAIFWVLAGAVVGLTSPAGARVVVWDDRSLPVRQTMLVLLAMVFGLLVFYSGRLLMADYYYLRALKSERTQEAIQAGDYYRSAVGLDPREGLYWQSLGRFYSENYSDLAEPNLVRATKVNPHLADSWYYLAHFYQETGRSQATLAAYRRTLVADPSYAQAHFQIGLIHFDQADWRPAASHFRIAAEILPDPQPYLMLARSYLGSGKKKQAVATLRLARRRGFGNPEIDQLLQLEKR